MNVLQNFSKIAFWTLHNAMTVFTNEYFFFFKKAHVYELADDLYTAIKKYESILLKITLEWILALEAKV